MEKELLTAAEMLRGNRYPGRGIVVGKSADGKKGFLAYFIMGRSENSRNRILAVEEGVLRTLPFDESKVKDPSLIIYAAMRRVGDRVVLTNGDQTDTVAEAFNAGGDFFSALRTRTYEPDAPNYTPRISAVVDVKDFSYRMSILRRTPEGACEYGEYAFPAEAGVGHLIHTYEGDGDPLPSFVGAPRKVRVGEDFEGFAASLWEDLDGENKIALFACAFDLASGEAETRLFNKNVR